MTNQKSIFQVTSKTNFRKFQEQGQFLYFRKHQKFGFFLFKYAGPLTIENNQKWVLNNKFKTTSKSDSEVESTIISTAKNRP